LSVSETNLPKRGENVFLKPPRKAEHRTGAPAQGEAQRVAAVMRFSAFLLFMIHI
jgi:hypothetical protein